jgi:hypothetical protein
MPKKQVVEIAAANGEKKNFTVNKDGHVNIAASKFTNENGGNVKKHVKVKTPVKKDDDGRYYVSK